MRLTLDQVKLERQPNMSILLSASGVEILLSEDDCMALSRALAGVAVNNPPKCKVHLENGARSAYLERIR